MSVTDELRAELTKRGVKWSNRDGFNDYKTVWHHAHTSYLLIESLFYSDTTILKVRKPTVAQAIAATLGAGTCEADETDLIPFARADSSDLDVDYIHVMECSACGGTYEHINGSYEFCPRCGRRIKEV